MKKLFIAVLAVAGLASCMQDEVLSQDQAAIEFGDAFVDNATKASGALYEGDNKVDSFKVWGTVTGAGNTVVLYDGANVTRGGANYGDAWSCDVTRFWTASCTYKFYAVVDATTVTADSGVVKSISYDANGVNDLLYGYAEASTDANNVVTGLNETKTAVPFTMQHLLSRIQFTFVNGNPQATDDKGAYSFKVTELSVGALASGTCAIPAKTWEGSGSKTIGFAGNYNPDDAGTKISEGKVIIPGKQTLTVSYKYEVYFDNDTNDSVAAKLIYETPNAITASLTDFTFAVGTSYNIVAELKLDNKIEFTIESVKWENDTPTTIQ